MTDEAFEVLDGNGDPLIPAAVVYGEVTIARSAPSWRKPEVDPHELASHLIRVSCEDAASVRLDGFLRDEEGTTYSVLRECDRRAGSPLTATFEVREGVG